MLSLRLYVVLLPLTWQIPQSVRGNRKSQRRTIESLVIRQMMIPEAERFFRTISGLAPVSVSGCGDPAIVSLQRGVGASLFQQRPKGCFGLYACSFFAAAIMMPVFKSSRRDFSFGPWKLTAARTHIMKSAEAERCE